MEGSSPFKKMSPLSNTPGKTNIEPAPVTLPILHGTSEDCPNTVDLFKEVPIPSFHPSAGSAEKKTPWPLVLQRLSSVKTSGFVQLILGAWPVCPEQFSGDGMFLTPIFGAISSTLTRNRELYTWRQAK